MQQLKHLCDRGSDDRGLICETNPPISGAVQLVSSGHTRGTLAPLRCLQLAEMSGVATVMVESVEKHIVHKNMPTHLQIPRQWLEGAENLQLPLVDRQ
jgi:hypothetical protein